MTLQAKDWRCFYLKKKKEPKVTKKIPILREKSRFQFFARAHRDFEIFKNVVLDFCDVQSLAKAKRLRKSMNCSFTITVCSGTVESFCIRTQKQWENEMALLLERDSIL